MNADGKLDDMPSGPVVDTATDLYMILREYCHWNMAFTRKYFEYWCYVIEKREAKAREDLGNRLKEYDIDTLTEAFRYGLEHFDELEELTEERAKGGRDFLLKLKAELQMRDDAIMVHMKRVREVGVKKAEEALKSTEFANLLARKQGEILRQPDAAILEDFQYFLVTLPYLINHLEEISAIVVQLLSHEASRP